MRDDLTEAIFIIDMSGSMHDLSSDTIGGYNTLIDEQKNQSGDVNVTTVLFNSKYTKLHNCVPVRQVNKLTNKEYIPQSTTAMLDAVGTTIQSVGQRLSNTPENERPSKIIVTIITDGYENASKEYTWSQVQSMIKEQREKYSWIFTFIGANIDTEKVSSDLGIDCRLAKSYTANKTGTDSIYKTMSKVVSYSASVNCLDEEKLENVSKLMDEIK